MPKVVLEFEVSDKGTANIRQISTEVQKSFDSIRASSDSMGRTASAAGEAVERSARSIADAITRIAEAPVATARAIREVAAAGRDFADSASTVVKTAALVYTGYKIGLPVLEAASVAYRGVQAGALLAKDATTLLVGATKVGLEAAFTPLGAAVIVASAAYKTYSGVLDSVARSQAEVNLQIDRTDYERAARRYVELATDIETFRIRGTLGFTDFSTKVQESAGSAYDSMGRFMAGVADWLGSQLPGELGTALQTWRNYYREIDLAATGSLFEQVNATKVALLRQEGVVAAATQAVQAAVKRRNLAETIPERQGGTAGLQAAMAAQVEAERDRLQIVIEQLNKDTQNPQKIADQEVNRQKLFNAIDLRRRLLEIQQGTNQELDREDAKFTREVLTRRRNAQEEAEVAIANLRIQTAEDTESRLLLKQEAGIDAALHQYDKDYKAFGQTEAGKRVAAERLMVAVAGIQMQTTQNQNAAIAHRLLAEIKGAEATQAVYANAVAMQEALQLEITRSGEGELDKRLRDVEDWERAKIKLIAESGASEASQYEMATAVYAEGAARRLRIESDFHDTVRDLVKSDTNLRMLAYRESEYGAQVTAEQILDTEQRQFREMKRLYDDDVAKFVNTQILKSGYLTDAGRLRMDQEAAWYDWQEKRRQQDLQAAVTILRAQAEAQGSVWLAMQAGALATYGQLGTFWGNVEKGFETTFTDVNRLGSDILFDGLKTGFTNAGDYAEQFGWRMVRVFMDILSAEATKQFLGLLFGVGGGGGGFTFGTGGGGAGGGGAFGLAANTASLLGGANSLAGGGLAGWLTGLLSGGPTAAGFASAGAGITAANLAADLAAAGLGGGVAAGWGATTGIASGFGAGETAMGGTVAGAGVGLSALPFLALAAPLIPILSTLIGGEPAWDLRMKQQDILEGIFQQNPGVLATVTRNMLAKIYSGDMSFSSSGTTLTGGVNWGGIAVNDQLVQGAFHDMFQGRRGLNPAYDAMLGAWEGQQRAAQAIEMAPGEYALANPGLTWLADLQARYPMEDLTTARSGGWESEMSGGTLPVRRQFGGPLEAGGSYLVHGGEALVFPRQGGAVVPADQTREALQRGGGGDTINVYVEITNSGIIGTDEISEEVGWKIWKAYNRIAKRRRRY